MVAGGDDQGRLGVGLEHLSAVDEEARVGGRLDDVNSLEHRAGVGAYVQANVQDDVHVVLRFVLR